MEAGGEPGDDDTLVYPEFARHQPLWAKRFSLYNTTLPDLTWARARLDYRLTR
jgi:hypothetical protein